jgi:exonuclease III
MVKGLWGRLREVQRTLGEFRFTDRINQEEAASTNKGPEDWYETAGELKKIGEAIMEGIGDNMLHRYVPRQWPSDSFENWVERVIRCWEWQRRYAFRRWKPGDQDNWDWVKNVESSKFKHPRKSHNPPIMEGGRSENVYELDEETAKETTGMLSTVRGDEHPRQRGKSPTGQANKGEGQLQTQGKRRDREGRQADGLGEIERRQAEVESETIGDKNEWCNEYGQGVSSEVEADQRDTSKLRVMVYNVGGLHSYKINDIVRLMKNNKVDYVALLDVRMEQYHIDRLDRQLQKRMGAVYKVMGKGLKWQEGRANVGGQIIIFRRDVCKGVKITFDDEVGGMAMADMKVGEVAMRILSVYWPIKNEREGTMWQTLGGGECIPQLKSTGQMRIQQALDQGRTVLYMGDFNSDLEKNDRYKLREHIAECGLMHTAEDLTLVSYVGAVPPDKLNEVLKKGGAGASRIDHIFHKGVGIKRHAARPMRISKLQSDHLPMCAVLHIEGDINRGNIIRQELDMDIDMKNKGLVETIRKKFSEMERPCGTAEEQLQKTAEMSVAIVRALQKKRKGWRDGWSPTMMVLQCALRMMVHCRRCIYSKSEQYQWTERTFPDKRREAFRSWARTVRKIATVRGALNQDQLNMWLGEEEFHWIALRRMNRSEFIVKVDDHIREARRQLHGKNRKRLRLEMHDAVARREENRIAGQLATVLTSMLGPYRKQRKRFSLEYVRVGEQVITDAEVAHYTISNSCEKWFATPEYVRDKTIGHVNATGEELCVTWEQFEEQHREDGIPLHVLQNIWRSAGIKVARQEQYKEVPTWEEFMSSIRTCKANSAAGMSGLSYNMIKLWPEHICRGVYEALKYTWENGITPKQWKEKWLVPIPKVEDPEIGELRPLVLIDAIRKIWMRVFAWRLQQEWRKARVLQENQHGCIKGKSTDTATMVMINAMETAKEFCTKLFMSSWDMKKAFDSVSKALCIYALVRLGVPEEMARYIVEMDVGGGDRGAYAVCITTKEEGQKDGRLKLCGRKRDRTRRCSIAINLDSSIRYAIMCASHS